MTKKISVGSVCSGIEAASVALNNLNFEIKWFSEIADFPSKVLAEKYPETPNIGDMCNIPNELSSGKVEQVDLICGGTPCQAFSLAGLKKGLDDDRGNLTLKFIDIVEKNDDIRKKHNLSKSIVLWENVEGVLKDKTNAFGCLISSLLGLSDVIKLNKWPSSGVIHGIERNIAWRVLDAKYFGLPQQRKRLYLLAGDKNFYPENILIDQFPTSTPEYLNSSISFNKNGYDIEVFRDYADCLYSAYGTKWNGNAAAYNGSLFVSQNDRVRRLTPLECERLMGFPDDYTNVSNAKSTARFQAIGNSWAVPVVNWIAKKLEKEIINPTNSIFDSDYFPLELIENISDKCNFYKIPTERNTNSYSLLYEDNFNFNGSIIPQNPLLGNIKDIIETDVDSKYYISPVGCHGILRRSKERCVKINPRLERVLYLVSNTMSLTEIEKKSRTQKRGSLSS